MSRFRKRLVAAIALAIVCSTSAASARPGVLISSFGDDGLALAPIGGRADFATASARGKDGKIILGGMSVGPRGKADFAVARLSTRGTPDRSFGSRGALTLDLGADDYALDVATDARSGRIILAGYRVRKIEDGYNSDLVVAALTKAGSVDRSFNATGRAIINVSADHLGGEYASAVAVQPDGKIILAGGLIAGAIVGEGPDQLFGADSGALLVVRLMPDGTFDPTFGTGGRVLLKTDADLEAASDMELLADGSIVLAGHRRTDEGFDALLVKLTPVGTLDPTFGTGGRTITDLGDSEGASSLARDSKGRLAVTGWQLRGRGDDRVLAARYTPAGMPDTSFSRDGATAVAVPTGDDGGQGTSIVFNGTGVIIAVGSTRCVTYRQGNWTTILCRYVTELVKLRSSGSIDTSFGSSGWTRRIPFESAGRIAASGGALLAAGAAPGAGGADMAATLVDL